MRKGVNNYRKEKQRLFCQGHSGKKRFYKKVLKSWEEEGVGTDHAQFIITINKGYSFEQDNHLHTMSFTTPQKAMDGIKKIYTCGCDWCRT
jgi:hypothetical protein